MTQPGSVLAVDFGNVHTRAVLIDLVEGTYRMVAQGRVRTTAGAPVDDIGVGLERVLEQIAAITGRKFIDANGLIMPERPDRSGMDAFVATASIGRPLQAALVGLMPEVSIASGLRAAAGTYVQIVETISLEDVRGEEAQLNALLTSKPDLFYITGGTEDGAQAPVRRLLSLVQLAVAVLEERKLTPKVLYAGNSALIPELQRMFPKPGTLLIAGNVRPSLEQETLESAQGALARAFDAIKGSSDESFEALGELSRVGVIPTSQTYNLLADYLGQTTRSNVLLVDVGSAVSVLAASVGGRVTTTIRTDLGIGHNAHALVEALGADSVRGWLPFNISHAQLNNYALNKTLRLGTVPATLRDLYLEHGLLRAAVSGLLETARPLWTPEADNSADVPQPYFARIIGAGAGIAGTGSPGMSALLLLDTLQPTGIVTLQSDPFGLIPALGSLAHVHPQAVVQMLDSDGFETLGSAIILEGSIRPGRPALQITLISADGYRSDYKVNGGDLFTYAATNTEEVEVEFKPLNGAAVNGSRRRQRMLLRGGTAGIIVDARGRPLPVTNARVRAQQMPLWLSQMTGDIVRAIDANLLEQEAAEAGEFIPAQGRSRSERRAAQQREREQKRAETAARKASRSRRGTAETATEDAQEIPIPAAPVAAPAASAKPTPARGGGRRRGKQEDLGEIEFPDLDVFDQKEEERDSLRDLRDSLR